MSTSDSAELLAGLLGFAAGVVFDHYVTPSVSYCYVPAHAPYQHRSNAPVRIPVESSCTRNIPAPTVKESPAMSSNVVVPKTDAQNIAALQSLLQSQQQQALTAAYTGVAIGVVAVATGVAIAYLPKLLKKKKNRPNNTRNASPQPQQMQQQPQQQLPQSPATGVYQPIQGTAPQNPAASYPTTYSL